MTRAPVPLPLGAYASRVMDSVSMRPGSETIIEAIARGIADQEAMILLLDKAEQSGHPLPLHVAESLRFNALKVAGLANSILARGMTAARHERSGVPTSHGSPAPLPGASDLVTFTDAPPLSNPSVEVLPASRLDETAGASASTPCSARIRATAGAPDNSHGEA